MYINFMNDENKNIYITYWLLLTTVLVALMIVVGGLTRLTDSGLSITNWGLFSGILPLLSLKFSSKCSLILSLPSRLGSVSKISIIFFYHNIFNSFV